MRSTVSTETEHRPSPVQQLAGFRYPDTVIAPGTVSHDRAVVPSKLKGFELVLQITTTQFRQKNLPGPIVALIVAQIHIINTMMSRSFLSPSLHLALPIFTSSPAVFVS
ncbi:uncharacterized protein PITG_17801 [Phytophthora infestans T30-4]|uniref:Uncharacterized protein n=2 Tax=Phytophthora infestans TaxID=4787 RepID=D0NWA8_PHYIT|nr:uncharacterized protein PITG_17801 [Phytophthora infestans T30-4]EEY66925.1 hypothetical protein PITG_17801 [Phytophthora infestans T30-4]|eukprot:XP_002896643.1 hypothetical protein PITG_17801 [Phytophthora infestans T30-4]